MLFAPVNRRRKTFLQSRKGLGISALPGGTGGGESGVTPTTILEIYGEYWDGVNMNPPYIGTAITEVGTIQSLGPIAPLNKKTIVNIQNGAHLSLANTLNVDNDNYVMFQVAQLSLGVEGVVVDFRKADNTEYRLMNLSRSSLGSQYNGYHYGTSSLLGSYTDVGAPEDTRLYKIRCWIFQAGQGKFYLAGGSARHTDSWQPTFLGGVGYRSQLFRLFAFSHVQSVAHLSIHKFNAADLVSLAWVNTYGNALNVYYDGLSWTDIV